VNLDPSLSQPYSHDFTAYLERQLAPTLGARVGFVFKSEDELIQSFIPGRPASAYTLPYSFVDIGADGRSGTSDDRTLTLLAVPSALASQFPVNSLVTNVDNSSRFKTVEASMNKRMSNRWSMQAGGSYTWSSQFFEVNNPNATSNADTTRWDFKVSGSYEAPYGFRISPLVRHQAGANFARTISVGAGVATAAGGIFSGTIDAEPRDARRNDNITVFDVRVERGFNLGRGLRLRGFLDAFNVTNSNAVEVRTVTTGTSFLRPTAILSPRTFRLGTRLSW
jgi:DMSO/TMAO reductase YedYZ molybdopterin-dependent catalytic subunit